MTPLNDDWYRCCQADLLSARQERCREGGAYTNAQIDKNRLRPNFRRFFDLVYFFGPDPMTEPGVQICDQFLAQFWHTYSRKTALIHT